MSRKPGAIEDTIVALASAPGRSNRAIVRVSGPLTQSVVESVFLQAAETATDGVSVDGFRSWRWRDGRLRLVALGPPAIPATLFFMAAPRSYTREDVAELHIPGNPQLAAVLIDQICSEGARLAEPGEFTRRAFVAGRIDLSQAEAVIALIHARSEKDFSTGAELLEGTFGREVSSLRSEILSLLSLLEAAIDFSDQEIEVADPAEIRWAVDRLIVRIDRLLLPNSNAVTSLAETPRVLLYGPSNAGKSSLFNGLVGEDRAIVDALPSTTREGHEADVDLAGIEILLRDSAGLPGDEPSPASDANDGAVKMSRRLVELADLVLLVVDASGAVRPSVEDWMPIERTTQTIGILNKSDLPRAHWVEGVETLWRRVSVPFLTVSAKCKFGLSELQDAIRSRILERGEILSGDVARTVIRHRQLLTDAKEALVRAKERLDEHDPVELAATDLSEALDRSGEITGDGAPEELLDLIFSRFCIGK